LYQVQSKLAQNQSQSSILDNSIEDKTQLGDDHLLPSQKVIKGMTYRKLKPEVKMTLEKVVYQLELVAKTLQLMEQRVMDSEDKLQMIMTHIKNNDLDFEPEIVN
jgi:hypothetical protein